MEVVGAEVCFSHVISRVETVAEGSGPRSEGVAVACGGGDGAAGGGRHGAGCWKPSGETEASAFEPGASVSPLREREGAELRRRAPRGWISGVPPNDARGLGRPWELPEAYVWRENGTRASASIFSGTNTAR